MKWFKHISDSLDDPFIFDLMAEFGADGYLVFFGVLEIYAREFKPELGWKLKVTRAYLKQKLSKSRDKLIINSLKFIQNSGKWEIEITDRDVVIFIPKFTELLDEWTMRKLGSRSGVTPKILSADKDTDKDKDTPIPPKGEVYSKEFLSFWKCYPRKVGKDAAWKKWKSRNGDRPTLENILSSLEKQKSSEQWKKDGGQFIPHPSTWLSAGRWADETENTNQKGLW